jgi:hypothetical protein
MQPVGGEPEPRTIVPRTSLLTVALALLIGAACGRPDDPQQLPPPPDPSLHQGASTRGSVTVLPQYDDTLPPGAIDTTLLPETLPPAPPGVPPAQGPVRRDVAPQ